jgi:hypothetical protein
MRNIDRVDLKIEITERFMKYLEDTAINPFNCSKTQKMKPSDESVIRFYKVRDTFINDLVDIAEENK